MLALIQGHPNIDAVVFYIVATALLRKLNRLDPSYRN